MGDEDTTLRERYEMTQWFQKLDEQQKSEVLFAVTYLLGFQHGTDYHRRLLLIAEMAGQLNQAEATIEALTPKIAR